MLNDLSLNTKCDLEADVNLPQNGGLKFIFIEWPCSEIVPTVTLPSKSHFHILEHAQMLLLTTSF